MNKQVKMILKKVLSFCGYEIKKINSQFYGLKNDGFNLIVDVGANNGSLSKFFLDTYPSANVYAFEPNVNHLKALKKIELKYRNRFTPEFKGIGSLNTTISLNVHNEHDASSSFLELSEFGIEELNKFTNADVTVQEKMSVPVITLDEYFKNFNLAESKILLKSDTQGFEMEVFKGGESFLKSVNTIIVETDFFSFYENQSNPLGIINYLYARDFVLTGFTYPPGINEKGEILGADLIFRKASTRYSSR